MTALIWGALPQPRSDRQKDRVETNPEQLTAASVQAEISFKEKNLFQFITMLNNLIHHDIIQLSISRAKLSQNMIIALIFKLFGF